MNSKPRRELLRMETIAEHFEAKKSELAAALQGHIVADRFIRVAMTAISQNPQLRECSHRSLWNACLRAAQDHLLPDGREAALIIRTDKNGDKYASYQVMVAGWRKKAQESGEILKWEVHSVYARDIFEYQLGDNAGITHRPHLGKDRGPLVGAYSIAVLKSGEISREVMATDEILEIRDRYSDAWRTSKNKRLTPWGSNESEMFKKTVAKRHAKQLPIAILDEDDQLPPGEAVEPLAKPVRLSQNALLERFANGGEGEQAQESEEAATDEPEQTEEAQEAQAEVDDRPT